MYLKHELYPVNSVCPRCSKNSSVPSRQNRFHSSRSEASEGRPVHHYFLACEPKSPHRVWVWGEFPRVQGISVFSQDPLKDTFWPSFKPTFTAASKCFYMYQVTWRFWGKAPACGDRSAAGPPSSQGGVLRHVQRARKGLWPWNIVEMVEIATYGVKHGWRP